VPEVLLSGDHAKIAEWRRRAATEKMRRNRPDLLGGESAER
jgi:tRNA (guanine37-N1)-methyltransferase